MVFHSNRILLVWLGLVVIGCGPTATKDVVAPAIKIATENSGFQPNLTEEWWESIFLQGQKIGQGKCTIEESRNERGEITQTRRQVEQHLKIKRFGQTTEQIITYETVESPKGELLSLRASLAGKAAATTEFSTLGKVREGMLELITATRGREAKTAIPWHNDHAGFFGVEQSLRKKPLTVGEKRDVMYFHPISNHLAADSLFALGWENSPLLEGQQKLLKIQCDSKLEGQAMRSFLWCDEQGKIYRSSMPSMGQESYRTTKALAETWNGPAYDLGRASVVKVDRNLQRHLEMKRVVYRARLKAANPVEQFPDCLSQRVESEDEHTAKITVRRVSPTEPLVLESVIAAPEPADSAANPLVQSDDPHVRKLAAEIRGENAWSTAIAIEKFVHEKVSKKNFSQAFASAAEVAQKLEGDCTEHAVLLAAICRAKKIPARVAAGLVYYGVEQGFAYHMWNEVWIDNRWVPLDATLARGGIGGGHLKLFDSNLDGAGAFSAFLPVVNVLGQLQLEILEVE